MNINRIYWIGPYRAMILPCLFPCGACWFAYVAIAYWTMWALPKCTRESAAGPAARRWAHSASRCSVAARLQALEARCSLHTHMSYICVYIYATYNTYNHSTHNIYMERKRMGDHKYMYKYIYIYILLLWILYVTYVNICIV